jgi:putative aminopeptidase FrvX
MPHSRSELAALVAAALLSSALPVAARAQRRPPPPRPVPQMADGQSIAELLLRGPAPSPGQTGLGSGSDLMRTLGWRSDSLGNWMLRVGSGSPRRVVACGVDEPGYVVSEITDDGYLRLQAPADPRRHPLWDQFHEGQRVFVGTPANGVWGVTAVRSTHLWRRRAPETVPTTVEDLWVDIGARSRREVEARGVRLLVPVRREPALWVYGGADTLLSGPGMARRAGCAAVATAATRGAPARGETVFVLSTQSAFQYAGLSAVLARLGAVDSLVIVDPSLASLDTSAARGGATAVAALPQGIRLPRAAARGARLALNVPSRFTGSLVESVSARDLRALEARVAQLSGTAARSAPAPRTILGFGSSEEERSDSLSDVGDVLARLTAVYALSEHEQPMRDAVLRELPAWARARTTTDSAGNLVLALGPDRDTVVFMAHMDEIGFEITSIARDGTVSLRQRGGFFLSLFEGQPALLHYETESDAARWRSARGCGLTSGETGLRGVFVPRESATTKQPAQLTAWFGTDSAGLAACGVRAGMAITGEKRPLRLTGTRFTARSIDDRAGCTALILALREIDPAKLTHKVIFSWSVREETALGGAAAMAATLGPTVKRVYAVDTFVSSDSPLESPRFALAPIGAGAVVRALDNSSATPPAETDRVVRIARDAGIPLQVGTTNGGNDGSEFVRYGAVDVPISWPLRYSHSPAEVIDLVDVRSLARLVAALARQ